MLQRKVKHATKMLLVVALLVSAGTRAIAQSPATASKIAKAMADRLAYLQLTSDQRPTADKLNYAAASALIQAAKKGQNRYKFSGQGIGRPGNWYYETAQTGLQKTLNSEQQKLFQEHKFAKMADVQTKIMIAQLDLSGTQMRQVYDLNLKSTTKIV